MLKNFKKTLVLMLAFCLCCTTVIGAHATGISGLKLDIENKSVLSGETFDVNVSVTENIGIIALRLMIEYDDSVLTLNSVTDSGIFGENVSYTDYSSPYLIVWESSTAEVNNTATGKLLTLRFTAGDIAEDSNTTVKLSIASENDCLDKDLNKIPLTVSGGNVAVSAVTVVKGDLNSDGVVDSNDAIYLLYHTAMDADSYPLNQYCDFDVSGVVDEADAVYLLYYSLFGAEWYPIN